MTDTIIVLTPHTDDSELGAGGTISKFIEEKKEVFYAVFSTCEKSVPEGYPINTLECEVKKAAEVLGVRKNHIIIFKYEVRNFPRYRQEILEDMVKLQLDLLPEIILMPSLSDTHQDHEVISREAIRAFKKTSSLLGYEEPWNHITFAATAFVQLKEEHIEKKIESLKQYESQKGNTYFGEEFIRGLARVRGAQIGVQYAEAFEIVRLIMR